VEHVYIGSEVYKVVEYEQNIVSGKCQRIRILGNVKAGLQHFINQYAVVLVLVTVVIIVSIATPSFITIQNFSNIFKQISVLGIMCCGSALVIISGMIDLSVGSVISVSGVLYVITYQYMGIVPAVLICIGVGAACGLVTGGILATINGTMSTSFIVTFGMQSILAAFALILSGGTSKQGNLDDTIFMSMGTGIVPFMICIVVVLVIQFFLLKTQTGRIIYFIGKNEEATRLSGIRTKFHRILVFALSGMTAALAAVVMVARVGSASPTAGSGYELNVIAAIVVGGVSLAGGSGNILNALLGVVVMGVLSNALNMLGISSYPQMVISGLLILIAVLSDIAIKKRMAF
jgi:ribose/xylose/arabinose/galactoside ABC-type transport system permease subunit